MTKLTRDQRREIARKRLRNILSRHGIANARTLEQKISDAGPNPQRIDPHILTEERNALVVKGELIEVRHADIPWYHLSTTPPNVVQARLDTQLAVYRPLSNRDVHLRLGQTLEIATYRALRTSDCEYFGWFPDIDAHDDSTLYTKQEPPSHIRNRSIGNRNLVFLVRHPDAGYLGLECKNVRPWLYPDADEVKETLVKCLVLDCVPVLIGRRIHFSTFRVLGTCGLIMHQTFNQLMPDADAALASQARDRMLLGYHDIRTGNKPDARLEAFIGTNMMAAAIEAREKFDEYRDLLESYVRGMSWKEFAARVRRRRSGQANEDSDEEEE